MIPGMRGWQAESVARGIAVCAGAFFWGLALAGCSFIEPTNPCDPQADPDIRAVGAISGQVLDQEGRAISGVTVLIAGRGDATISGADGTFTLENLPPNEGDVGYELLALPPDSMVGGRVSAAPLSCQQKSVSVDLRVLEKPPAPEVEIAQASAPDRLFVAFPAVGEDEGELETMAETLAATCDPTVKGDRPMWYRVQVRAPFGDWHDAALTLAPQRRVNVSGNRMADDDGVVAEASTVGDTVGTIDGFAPEELMRSVAAECGRALCADFVHAHPALQTSTALCADVVGQFVEDPDGNETLAPLEAYGTYSIRVLTDYVVPRALVDDYKMPAILQSAPTAFSHRTSLVPQVMIPALMADDEASQAQAMDDMKVMAMVAINQNRFALVNDAESLMVLGTMTESGFSGGDQSASTDDMAMSGATTSEATGASQADEYGSSAPGRLLAMLPAGNWVRLWKQTEDQVVGEEAMVRKVWIGPDDATGTENVQPTSVFPVSFDGGLEERFRRFAWLSRPVGAPTDQGYNPGDGYLLLFDSGFVLLERGKRVDLRMRQLAGLLDTSFLDRFDDPMEAEHPYWGGRIASGLLGGLLQRGRGDLCQHPNLLPNRMAPVETHGSEPLNPEESVRICFDIGHALGRPVDLSGVLNLSAGSTSDLEGDDLVDATVHLFADRQNGVVYSVESRHLMGRLGLNRLPQVITELPVGEAPSAMLASRILTCPAGTAEPAALVANTGSRDISILQLRSDDSGRQVVETRVVPLPAGPTGFIRDSRPLTCADPFVWVQTEEGTLIPLDMRTEILDVPPCGEERCEVLARGRVLTGAIGRAETGRGRVMLGGRGIVSEVGFLRPADAN
jgi:hypothetical protein